jgi:hypothetical protein
MVVFNNEVCSTFTPMSSRTLSDHVYQLSSRRSCGRPTGPAFPVVFLGPKSSAVLAHTIHAALPMFPSYHIKMSSYCCPRSTECIPSAQLLSCAATTTVHFWFLCFFHFPVMYIACSLTLLEGQTAITCKFQYNKSCISSVPVSAVPAVAPPSV